MAKNPDRKSMPAAPELPVAGTQAADGAAVGKRGARKSRKMLPTFAEPARRPSLHPWSADVLPSPAARELCRVPELQVAQRTRPEQLPEQPHKSAGLLELVDPIARRALLLGLLMREKRFHVFVACDPEVVVDEDVVRFAQRVFATEAPPASIRAPASTDASALQPAPTADEPAAALPRLATGLFDLVYVHDFARPEAPRPLRLPPATGPLLQGRMKALMAHLSAEIPQLIDRDSVKRAQAQLAQKLDEKSKHIVTGLESTAKTLGFGVRSVQGGLHTFPILHGKPLSPEQFAVLDEPTRRALAEGEEKLTREVSRAGELVQREAKKFERAREEALGKTAHKIIDEALLALREVSHDLGPEIAAYFDDVQGALREGWADFVIPRAESAALREPESDEERDGDPEHATRLLRFAVNVLVSHAESASRPVVYATSATYPNLFGYLERRARFGALLTDFTRIRAGAMHQANGGVLVVRAADLLADPIIWERFKRVLREGQLGAEDPLGPLGLYATTLRPAPVPMALRIVLVGTPSMYAALLDADQDFAALFRVKVEVADSVPRTHESLLALDAYLMALAADRGWGTFDRPARAMLLDLASRLASERDRLSLCLQPLEETAAFAGAIAAAREVAGAQVLAESGAESGRPSFRAAVAPVRPIGTEDVLAAYHERRQRSGAAERQFRELVVSGEINVETTGLRVGCINGLSVLSTGDVEFGQPMRITAVVGLGREGVIDVEREAQLSGSIHTKGMAILRGYLSRIFGQERPLSLRAQIAFEQSYGEVDGDSASAAELFALTSALADVGIDQSLAVTGSINQLGSVQAIGGVCAKIEGFFDLCNARGLTGAQGVVFPRSNLAHIVLRHDVVAAIEAGKFHLYAIDHVHQGIEILTGIPAGERDARGHLPAGSVFGRVERRLIEIAERLRVAEQPLAPPPAARETDELAAADLSDSADFGPRPARGLPPRPLRSR